MDARTWRGVESLIDAYARIRPSDLVIVLYTSDSQESVAWVSAALELRGIATRRVWMAPLRDDGFTERLEAVLPSHEAARTNRVVVLTFERDTLSHTTRLANALARYEPQTCVVVRTISAGADLFSSAMLASPEELSARNAGLLARFSRAKRLRITTAGGTDLAVTLDPKFRWISNRGVLRPGRPMILPAGEVATYPATIDGTFVADFAFNVNAIVERDARLAAHPVTVRIADSRAASYHCDDPEIRRFLDDCFHTACAFGVGELGFGTNHEVGDPLALNSHVNERRTGVHVGFGQHNQDPGVVGHQCAIHLDLIARGGLVYVDDDPVPIDLEAPSASGPALPHPTDTRDEDVFSPEGAEVEVDDCCGVFTEDGLRLFRGGGGGGCGVEPVDP